MNQGNMAGTSEESSKNRAVDVRSDNILDLGVRLVPSTALVAPVSVSRPKANCLKPRCTQLNSSTGDGGGLGRLCRVYARASAPRHRITARSYQGRPRSLAPSSPRQPRVLKPGCPSQAPCAPEARLLCAQCAMYKSMPARGYCSTNPSVGHRSTNTKSIKHTYQSLYCSGVDLLLRSVRSGDWPSARGWSISCGM